MNEEQIKNMLDQKFKDVQAELKSLQDSGASKDELQKAIKAVEDQGLALQNFIDAQEAKVMKTYEQEFASFLWENKDEISKIYKAGAGEIEFNPFAEKAPAAVTTASGTEPGTAAPQVMNAQLGSFNLRDDNSLLSLCTVTNTSQAAIAYTEMLPKEGDYAFVAEAGAKPLIDFRWETRYLTPRKAAAHEILTEEAVTDYARMESVAREFLRKKHDLFKVNGVFFGDGTGNNPTGATVYGRTFVAGSMANAFASGASNFMDVVNAIITDIYTTANFTDEAHYMPNVVMISPIDFFLQFQSAKDANGLPLYPQASLFNSVNIGGVTIRPWAKIPAGQIFVADMSKYNIVNYVPFSVRIGWINDQFTTNQFTMVGESRYFQYVKNLDQAAFVYDTIATVVAAIEAP
jgi:hypothetical protein